ncbi:aminotransferase class V-fold PLP-dependent enzyme [Rhodococcus sp. ARC_M13]|nr:MULTISPECIES: aminotransferase class V-fold PLP-dependent enzyme [Rhodococcus]MCJ0896518.1 aminotransferase class V-fold PLP-dependent enzyme [Rhodococcus sp. ARC_M13]UKO87196.1 aminotransferase class V-fold PLP-dependent enzyme [Rhodococcus erythropolis]
MTPKPSLTGMPASGWRQYEIEQRLHELLASDPPLHTGWPDTLWPVLPDKALSASRAAMSQFAHLNGFVKPSSLNVIEAELLAMVRDHLGVPEDGATTLTVGGTESNFLAVKGALFKARENGGVPGQPNMVIPETAHPSFDKASEELGIDVRRIAVGNEFRADPEAMANQIDENTVLLVASTPNYTHGTLDPVKELAALAQTHDLWFHIDACVGGCLLPALKRVAGESSTTPFDYPGVTSVSADLHKFGFTPTGISTLSVNSSELIRHHSFSIDVASSWPFRPYRRTGFTGSRSGAVLAGAWATLVALGRDGYEQIAQEIVSGADIFAKGLSTIAGFELVAPHESGIIVFTSTDPQCQIERVANVLERDGWPAMLAVSPPRLQFLLSPLPAHYYEEFIEAIRAAANEVRTGVAIDGAELTTYGA